MIRFLRKRHKVEVKVNLTWYDLIAGFGCSSKCKCRVEDVCRIEILFAKWNGLITNLFYCTQRITQEAIVFTVTKLPEENACNSISLRLFFISCIYCEKKSHIHNMYISIIYLLTLQYIIVNIKNMLYMLLLFNYTHLFSKLC